MNNLILSLSEDLFTNSIVGEIYLGSRPDFFINEEFFNKWNGDSLCYVDTLKDVTVSYQGFGDFNI